ncbi:MAG TPA: MEDS domain-containing protein, partial [Ferruginibacter sp.]|nr:MEDS domain-containing protein [Ferruginibacter sp.]
MNSTGFKSSEIQDFWGEIAPCNHVLQVYENTEEFISTLTGFVFDGFNAGDSVIVIATAEHLESLNNRLTVNAIDIEELKNNGQYKPLDAEETLSRFMVKGWPDEDLFMQLVASLVKDAR